MKFYLSVFCLLIGFTLFGQRKIIDKVIAQVGDYDVLLSDLETQKQQAKLAEITIGENFECEVMEELLYQNLLLLQADIDSVTIPDSQVDAEMENRIRVIEQQMGGRQKLEEFYGKTVSQIKNEFRDVIRRRLIVEEMERKITNDLHVTPDEIKAYYQNIPFDSLPLISSEIKLQQITIFPEITNEDKLIARRKLQSILDDIRINGKSFETQAKLHSEDPGSASRGGIMEATVGMMVPAFENVVMSLEEGQVSEIFETEFGYHIAKLLKRNGNDYICSHILIIPTFSREQLISSNNLIEEAYQKLKRNEITWDDAVLKYSNDENTKFNRGIITNPYSGDQYWKMEDLNQVDQQVFLLIDKMQIGDFSAPALYFDITERKQGIRIVRVMDRTKPHRANLEDDYGMIQDATKNWKKQEIIKKWTTNKIKSAYIRIDDNYKSCDFMNEWIKK
ncbi:MAG: peptidylprolyl isomerase [Flavobacteriia bacterium]|nr:peptidylprolyl isomerase [Flavobacteriia bacterium]OJX37155.1 MAG: hypothetical protein BGO87_15470 [Flavobacteriia bacterium 40-80]